MSKVMSIVALVAVMALGGCGNTKSSAKVGSGTVGGSDARKPRGTEPAATTPGAESETAKPVAAEGATPSAGEGDAARPAAAGAGALTPANTSITFVGTKPGGRHDGGFKSFAGTIKPLGGDLTASTITVDIDTTSLWADNPKLTNHLKSPDFFEVKKHPKASFVSKAIKAEKKGDATHLITGDLTLHGTTKEIAVPAKVAMMDELLTIDSTFTIDRTEFGIAYRPEQVNKVVTIKVAAKVSRK